MAGLRPLTPCKEGILLRHIRRINVRDPALISAEMFFWGGGLTKVVEREGLYTGEAET